MASMLCQPICLEVLDIVYHMSKGAGGMDGGSKAFCRGIGLFAERDLHLPTGFGAFIERVVQDAMESRGLVYQSIEKPKRKSRGAKKGE